jgi:CrcB protein
MTQYLIVFFGAGIGGTLRHGVNLIAARLFGGGFPFGTLTVNVVGSIVMGLLAGYFAFRCEASQPWRLFLTTGVLGGFTTFSSFSLDSAVLWERHDFIPLILYVLISLIVSFAGLMAGLALMRQVMS